MVSTRTAESPTSVNKETGSDSSKKSTVKTSPKKTEFSEVVIEKAQEDEDGNLTVTIKEVKNSNVTSTAKSQNSSNKKKQNVSQESSTNGGEKKSDVYDDDEYRQESCTFESFRDALKSKKAISERWSISGILWDASVGLRLIVASELDITQDGSMRVKRCVKIFENLDIKVFMDGEDMTHKFDVADVETDVDVTQLINSVAMMKVCQGVKNFETSDLKTYPRVKKRGATWYSVDCGVIVEKGVVGNLCSSCCRLRNTIRRRRQKESTIDPTMPKVPARVVLSPFGKALYSTLNDLLNEGPLPKKRKKRDDMIFNENYQVYLNEEIAKRVSEAGKGDGHTPHQNILLQVGEGEEIQYYPITSQSATGVTSTIVMDPKGNPPQFLTSDMVQGVVSSESEGGNIIVQNYGDFALGDGQEYQLVGEASEGQDPVEVVEATGNEKIEIIEVDDATMAQFSSQNVGGVLLQDNTAFQVAGIEGGDQIIKVINSSNVAHSQA